MSITPQTLLRFTVGAVITAVVLFLMWYFSSIVIYILVSAVLAIMGRPLVARISRGRIGRWRVPRWCGALVTLLVIWIVFAVVCGLFVPLVTNKLYHLAHLDFSTVLTSVEEPLQRIQDYLTHFFSLPETQVSFKDTLISFLQSLINFDTINTAFSSVVSLAVSSVIAFFSISFMTTFIGTFVMSSFTVTLRFWARATEKPKNTAKTRVIRHLTCLILDFFINLLKG